VIGTDKTEKQTSESNFCEKRLFGPENLWHSGSKNIKRPQKHKNYEILTT
jgi:hypothetical protein